MGDRAHVIGVADDDGFPVDLVAVPLLVHRVGPSDGCFQPVKRDIG